MDEIKLSHRHLGRLRGRSPREDAKVRRMPAETGLAAEGSILSKEVNDVSSRGPPGLLRVPSLQRNLYKMHMASAEAAV